MIRQLTPPVATETLPVRPSTSERDENTQSPSRSQLKPGEVKNGTDPAVDSLTILPVLARSRVYAQYWIPNWKSHKMTFDRSLHNLRASHQTCQLSRSLRSFGNCLKHRGLEVGRERVTPPRRHYSHMARRQVVLHEVTRLVFAQISPIEKDTFAKHAGKFYWCPRRRTTGLYHLDSFTSLLQKYIRLFTFRDRSIDLPCVSPTPKP